METRVVNCPVTVRRTMANLLAQAINSDDAAAPGSSRRALGIESDDVLRRVPAGYRRTDYFS